MHKLRVVRFVGTDADLALVGSLRIMCWEMDGMLPSFLKRETGGLDEHDQHAVHWLAYDGSECVAAARLCFHRRAAEFPDANYYSGYEGRFQGLTAVMSRLVVAGAFRSHGLAKLLDALRLGEIASSEAEGRVAITHRTSRIEQLKIGADILGPSVEATVTGQTSYVIAGSAPFARATDNTDAATPNKHGWCATQLSELNERFVASINGPATVLDIGCGKGLSTLAALARGATVMANDKEISHLHHVALKAASLRPGHLSLLLGHFPECAPFPDSFDRIHASNVLHFLAPEQLTIAADVIRNLLKPGGLFFAQTCSPYVGNFKNFIPIYEGRLADGERWPGFIADVRCFADQGTAEQLPRSLTLMEASTVRQVFSEAGLVVHEAVAYRRASLPRMFYLDGRENVMLVASRPT